MEKGWAPKILDALFCDRRDHLGLYYWFDAIMEKKKWMKAKPGEKVKVTYEHL